ncbi:MAG: hypothetical protein H7308_19505 [Chthonomonadaceae bacterium]|nr:hypothetical protein [Chthonomonadaceae bacterium]
MLKSLLEIIRQLVGYANDTQKNTADIKALQADFDDLSDTVRQILFEIDRDRQIGARDRKNLLLRLENALLKNEQRALPSGSTL